MRTAPTPQPPPLRVPAGAEAPSAPDPGGSLARIAAAARELLEAEARVENARRALVQLLESPPAQASEAPRDSPVAQFVRQWLSGALSLPVQVCSSMQLFRAYLAHQLHVGGGRNRLTERAFAGEVRSLAAAPGIALEVRRLSVKGKRVTCWMPPGADRTGLDRRLEGFDDAVRNFIRAGGRKPANLPDATPRQPDDGTVAGFWVAWARGTLGVPYACCSVDQAYRAFAAYAGIEGQPGFKSTFTRRLVAASRAAAPGLAVAAPAVQILVVAIAGPNGRRTTRVVAVRPPPSDQPRGAWAGECVRQFEQSLQQYAKPKRTRSPRAATRRRRAEGRS